MSKRADLQGIRAFAVAMVIAYHLDPSLLPGGFVGVDVFFVLSGFLITQVIYSELERTGKIDLIAFWTRRIKRLLPNALFTLAAVLLASWTLLPAYRWQTVAWDVGSAAVLLSNFHFAETAVDYFRVDDPPSPVLHFWSLSIEEQFYIALPVLLLLMMPLVRRRPRFGTNAILALVTIGSLATCLWIMRSDQAAAFFYTQSRVWQLALGGLLGINFDARKHISSHIRGVAGWAGAAMIAFAALYFDDGTPYPGVNALVPTFGALALILGLDSGALANPLRSFVSLKPLAWIGDRSYSLYLWHWPVIIFAQSVAPLNATGKAVTLLIIVVTACTAYSYVERPIHHGDLRSWSRLRIPGYAVAAVGIVCLMAALLPNMPQPEQSIERTAAIEIASKDFGANYSDHCHLSYDELEQKPCVYGTNGAPHKVVLFGDSHAAQWFAPLERAARESGWELLAWTKTTCPWAQARIWYPPKKAFYDACTTWRENTISNVIQQKADIVVLGQLADYTGYFYDGAVLKGKQAETVWQKAILETIDRFEAAGIQIVVIADNPRMYKSFRDCLAMERGNCGRDRTEATTGASKMTQFIKSERPQVRILDLTNRICDANWCPAMRDGRILYQDLHHLRASYLVSFWPDMAALFDKD